MVTQDANRHERQWLDGHFIGNHPALDFVNTLSHRVDHTLCEDRLSSADDLRSWAVRSGLYRNSATDNVGGTDSNDPLVIQARLLREAAHQALLARISGQEPPLDAISTIAGCLEGVSDGIEFKTGSDFASCTASGSSGKSVLGVISLQIMDALLRLPSERLGACPACGWMFYDVTRGGRRRWCSMATCGNRSKVRQYRGRRDNPLPKEDAADG